MKSVYGGLLCVAGVLCWSTGAEAQNARLFLDPPGAVISPGGLVTLEVWVDDVPFPSGLRAYQSQVVISGGTSGTLVLADPTDPPPNWALFIDDSREDFVFSDYAHFVFETVPTLRLSSSRLSGGDGVPDPRYCGTYIFRATSDADGVFHVNFTDSTDTYLRSPDFPPDNDIPVDTFGATITVTDVCEDNDDCVDRCEITADGVTPFWTDLASSGGPALPPSCDEGNGIEFGPDSWFEYRATCDGPLYISTCGDADFDTRLAVYGTGFNSCTCPSDNFTLQACSDDAPGCSGFTSEVVLDATTAGQCHTIRVGSPDAEETGAGNLTVVCIGNDDCEGAEVLTVPTTVVGATRGATVDSGAAACGLPFESPGVWYSLWSTANQRMTASLCGGASFDTRLTVYESLFTCPTALTCVTDADDTCGSQEEVSWCTRSSRRYWILVHGVGGESGSFTLDVSVDDCDDGVACTDDSCDAGTDSCINEPIDCSDDNACTEDPCDPDTGVCLPSVPIFCDDGNACTDDACDEGTGCFFTNNSDSCDDNDACTEDDVCSAGACAGTPMDPEVGCYDSDACTDDLCDSGTGCYYLPTDCDDGDPCTIDTCHSVTGCIHDPDEGASCDDDDQCTTNDTCSATGECVGTPIDPAVVCDDLEPCTADLCDPDTGCIHPPADCDDGHPCTIDTCNPGIGCDHEPNTAAECDDGDPCTTGETCDSVGVCSGGGPTDCDDSNACTDDSCVAGAGCSFVENYDLDQECCDPATGNTAFIQDENPCTFGVCDPGTGEVTQIPVEDGLNVGCDDELDCTVDECLSGLCANIDVNTYPCQSIDECPDAATSCDDVAGECVCLEAPTLSFLPEAGSLPVGACYQPGEQITIRLDMGYSPTPIVAGQFYVEYDTSTLLFVRMEAGGMVDLESPFTLELGEYVDLIAGTIDYAVGAFDQDGTIEPATLTVLTFEAYAECDPFVNLRLHVPATRLIDAAGETYDWPGRLIIEGLPPISTDASPPAITACPADIAVNPDPGELFAEVVWDDPTAEDSCDGPVPVSCVPPSGSQFPIGTTPVACSAVNSCGIEESCIFDITVNPSTMTVDIEFSPVMAPGPITRCITFEFADCSGGGQLEYGYDVTFIDGLALGTVVPVPTGTWECVSARDVRHTLRSTATDLSTSDWISYTATFMDDPDSGGHWLTGGDLNDDGFVDALDYVLFLQQYLQPMDPNTPCGTTGLHADINGDGLVNVADLSFIQIAMFAASEPGCCGRRGGARCKDDEDCEVGAECKDHICATGSIKEVSIPDLYSRGLGHLCFGDVNEDGKLSREDVAAFIDLHGKGTGETSSSRPEPQGRPPQGAPTKRVRGYVPR